MNQPRSQPIERHDPDSYRFGTVAPRMWDLGWRGLVPVRTRLKRPAVRCWNWLCTNEQGRDGGDLNLDSLLSYSRDKRWGVGLCAGNGVMALDCDVEKTEHADRILEYLDRGLGRTPLLRVGRPPRFVALYRSDEPLRYTANIANLPIGFYPGGDAEAFGYVVVTGMHPDTGRPYGWPRSHPADTAPGQLPYVSQAALETVLAAMLRDSIIAPLVVQVSDLDVAGAADRLLFSDREVEDEALLMVRAAPVGARNDTAIRVGMAVARVFKLGGGDRGELERILDRLGDEFARSKPEDGKRWLQPGTGMRARILAYMDRWGD